MLMSVEIVSRCKLVKAWGVHQVWKSRLFTIGCGIVAGTVSLQMPPEPQDQPFVCSIGKSQNGPFQDRPCSIIKKNTALPHARVAV